MAVENFEAIIAANIRDFQNAMRDVDRQIRDAATGANAPIDANITDFMNQMRRVDADLADLARDHTVDIVADIAEFRVGMRSVNRLLSDVESGAIANIGAHTVDFDAAISQVDRHLNSIESGTTAEIEADILSFNRQMREVERQMRSAEAGADPAISADISRFLTDMAVVDARLADLARRHDVDIVADDRGSINRLWVRIRSLSNERVIVPVRLALKGYQNTIGAIATVHRNISEIYGMTAGGIKIALSPAIVPILASVVGLLGQLGPLLGVVGGSTFALASALFFAGTAALAFGAVAIPTIKKLLEEDAKLNKAQQAAKKELTSLKDTWNGVVKDLENPVLEAFGKSMQFANKVLQMARPLFDGAAIATNNLLTALNQSLDSPPIQAFFDYMNKQAGPLFEVIGKSIGYVLQGLLSMFTAFGPLAESTADGFLKMTQGFADWAAGLSESKKFQTFVDYVNENMPKIRSIFGDAFKGIINTFAAFAPSSADMMTSLKDMMARFKEWSSTLSENKGFQGFIDYVKENGPRVVDLIGNLTRFIIDMGVAFAPMGAKMLGIINGFLKWSSAMLQNHPWIGKIMVAAVVLGGALVALLPHIFGAISFIKALNAPMGTAQVTMLSMAKTFIVKMAQMAKGVILQGARMAAGFLVSIGPIGWVIAAVIALVILVIANWEKVSAWTSKAWTAVSTFVINAVSSIMSYIQTNFPVIYEVIVQYMTSAREIILAVWEYVKGSFTNALNFLKALVSGDFEGMKNAISDQMELAKATIERIWTAISDFISIAVAAIMGYIQNNFPMIHEIISQYMTSAKEIIIAVWAYVQGTFTNALSFLKALVDGDFQGMKDAISNQMDLAKATIERIWNAVKAYVDTILGTIGKVVLDKFKKIAQDVKDKMDEVKTSIDKKWEEAKSKAEEKLTNLVTSVKDFFTDIKDEVKEKMDEAVSTVKEKVGEMPGKVRESVSDMVSAGGELISGVIKGITEKIDEGLTAIGGFAKKLVARFKKDTDTHSPSRAFANVAKWIPPGVVSGIDKTRHLAINSVSDMASRLTDAFTPQLSMAGVDIAPMDSFSQMEALKNQIEQELQVDMTVKHRGGPDPNMTLDEPGKQPAHINLTLGGNDYSAFVDDITRKQELDLRRF